MIKLLRLPEVRAITRRSTTRIYADMATGRFPKPIKIGPRSVAWTAESIEAYINACIADAAA